MFSSHDGDTLGSARKFCTRTSFLVFAFTAFTLLASCANAQTQSDPAPSAQSQTQTDNGSQKQEAPPAAGGPQNEVGPYAVPAKKEEPPPPLRKNLNALRACLIIRCTWMSHW